MLSGMTPAPLRAAYRIGEFVFEPATGEVRRVDGSAGASSGSGSVRLPPQPAELLALLIEKDGGLASRDEIRAALWPATHVDFDQSLHFCVRQIRAAFGDSATEPTYVETLPRRGYRLMRPSRPVRPDRSGPGSRAEATPAPARRGTGRRPIAVAGLVVLLAAAGVGLVRSCRPPGPPDAIRLAIMPFERAGEGGGSDELARISERLVADLSGGRGGRLQVIGPRSTAAYSAFPFPDLDRLADELAADFVLNARLLEHEGDGRLIVELIRLEDGAHPWAELFPGTRAPDAIARTVRDGVVTALGLPAVDEPNDEEPGGVKP